MIGIRFEIPNSWGNYLGIMLDKVITKNFIWKTFDEEILLTNEKDLFDRDIYDDTNFRNIILNSKYYIIHGNILAFKSRNFKIIHNYQEFIESDCEILIVIVDSTFVDIYAKENSILKELERNAIRNNFKNIKYIYDDNSKRNIFYI